MVVVVDVEFQRNVELIIEASKISVQRVFGSKNSFYQKMNIKNRSLLRSTKYFIYGIPITTLIWTSNFFQHLYNMVVRSVI